MSCICDKGKDKDKDKQLPAFSCEQFKLLKVIGEKIVQVVSDTVDTLDFPAERILEIDFDLCETSDHAFTDKVIKQGIIRKRVVFCGCDGIVRCQTIEIPFTAVAEIPGVDPSLELEFQNSLVLKETDFTLLDSKTLSEKIVFEIKIKVSTWVQRKLKVCNSNIIKQIQISR